MPPQSPASMPLKLACGQMRVSKWKVVMRLTNEAFWKKHVRNNVHVLAAAAFVILLSLGFALYTNHAWDDFYITYRHSKNLAIGNGLVFNVGDRLHGFTSPLGVLLPALSSVLTGNTSDQAALWIYRLMCIGALGGAGAFLVAIARHLRYAVPVTGFLLALVAFDAKTLDFTTNGMETAFMLLFLSYAFWAHVCRPARQWLHLGVAWAGLMWTRPDGFIYVGVIAAGFLLFDDIRDWRRKMAIFIKAGLLTTVLYLPWFIFAWVYYGTPIPQPATAKGGLAALGEKKTIIGFLANTIRVPLMTYPQSTSLDGTFLPSYFQIGGWPGPMLAVARCVAVLCYLLWLLPVRLRLEVRTASFAFFGAHAYLSYFTIFAYPWYLPSTELLAFIALTGLLAQLSDWKPKLRPVLVGLGLLLLAGEIATTAQVTRQIRAQQTIVGDGNQRRVGEWLKENARSNDTVFLEPLGYIGFYSGLKMYDYPGLSSREVASAVKIFGNDWSGIVRLLKPDWLVLRQHEVIDNRNFYDLSVLDNYQLVREFSVMDEIAKQKVYGRAYLEFDGHFKLFSRRKPEPDTSVPAGLTLAPATKCQGSIDILDVVEARAFNSTYVIAQGWLAVSGEQGIVPDDVFITVATTDDAALRFYKALTRVPRNDVKIAFKQPSMPDVGYRVWIDLSKAHGKHIIGLARGYEGVLTPCSEIQKPIDLK